VLSYTVCPGCGRVLLGRGVGRLELRFTCLVASRVGGFLGVGVRFWGYAGRVCV